MRILLLEDDINFCEMLRFQLEQEQYEVTVCHDGMDGLDLFLQDAFDIVLLDRMLPTMNGLLILKKARQNGITTPVILITALGELYDRIEGLDTGADDYIVKPFAFEELAARIRSLNRRSYKCDDEHLLCIGDISYDKTVRLLNGPNTSIRLSGKEGRLLEVFLKNFQLVLRREVLLSRVWGADFQVEDCNLDTYVHYLRKRLTSAGSTLHLNTIRGIGYCLTDKTS